MPDPVPARRWQATIAAALVIAVALGGFALGRSLIGSDAQADPGHDGVIWDPAEVTPQTPFPGERPDSSRPAWYLPYTVAEEHAPRYDQVINGISILVNSDDAERAYLCPSEGELQWLEFDDVIGSAVGFNLDALVEAMPDIGEVHPGEATAMGCSDTTPVQAGVEYTFVADEGDNVRVRDGELHIFDARRGGSLNVTRLHLETPEVVASHLPAERWEATEIHGLPAAVAPPLFPDGYGRSMVVVWDQTERVMTVIWAWNFSDQDVLHIAQEMLK